MQIIITWNGALSDPWIVAPFCVVIGTDQRTASPFASPRSGSLNGVLLNEDADYEGVRTPAIRPGQSARSDAGGSFFLVVCVVAAHPPAAEEAALALLGAARPDLDSKAMRCLRLCRPGVLQPYGGAVCATPIWSFRSATPPARPCSRRHLWLRPAPRCRRCLSPGCADPNPRLRWSPHVCSASPGIAPSQVISASPCSGSWPVWGWPRPGCLAKPCDCRRRRKRPVWSRQRP